MDVQPSDKRTIFECALEFASGAEREAYLEDACAGKPEMRAQVDSLLKAHNDVGSFLDGPAFDAQRTAPMEPISEQPGAIIGPYKLLQQIGEGGMGVVFMAEQSEPIQRTVALKIIKPGMDTRQVIARFEAERQAVAMMDHPNIAKVLDAGATDSGRPYFVMELVKGVPITKYCDDKHLPLRARLELFTQVCQAVQHAHQKGVIHRDIKPNNVLVAEYDNQAVPKVIDFGVAKATAQKLTERTMFTEFGQVLGTMEYMSPEQAKFNQLDVDTRSDVYSLGVLLYELLAGSTPFEGKRLHEAAFDEVLRIIREEEPPKPSTRLSSLSLGERAGVRESLASIAANRQTEPARLSKDVRGELDWIVMKALEKDRTRRYETATGLARDVERYLNDEPVEACPPSAAYRVRKLARRYRVPVAVAAAFVALLALASVASTWQAVRATRAERQVARQRDEIHSALVQKQISERTARERLATQLIAVGDAALASGGSAARDSYNEAWDVARETGASMLPAEIGLLASYPEQPPPLMGNDGRRAGIGGFEGHTRVPSVAFMADGRRAVSVSFDGSIIIWDVARGAALRRFPGVEQNTYQIALSPDERWLLTADADKLVRLWDAATGEVIRTFSGHTDDVRSVDFSPDGKLAISGGSDKTIRLWDVATASEIRRLDAPSYVTGLRFLPDGRRAVSCGEPDVTVLWDLESGQAVHTMSEGSGSGLSALSLSPDGRTALTGGMSSVMMLWDLDSGEALRAFRGHSGPIRSVAFSPDGRRALSGGSDRTLRLWDVATARQIGTWHGHVGRIWNVCFSPDGQLALSSDVSGAVKLWDLREQQETAEFRGPRGGVISLSMSGDGRSVLSGSFDGTARLWDVATCLPLRTLEMGGATVWGVSLAPDDRTAISAQEDGTVALWDVDSGNRVRTLGKHDDVATSVAFSPDGRWALSGSSDMTLRLWDVQSGESVRTFTGHSYKIRAVTFSPDGRTALSASFDNTLKLWDVQSGKELRTFAGHTHWVQSVAFSPDGRRAASGGWDYRWGLWDVATGKELYFRKWDPAIVTGVAFSPDGKLLLSGSREGSIGLWDLVNNEHVRDLRRQRPSLERAASSSVATTTAAWAQERGVTSVAFCRDGVTMLAGSRDGVIRRWQLDRPARYDEFGKSLPRAREALGSNPNDAAALAEFGRWYAFRGVHDWAAEFLEKARDHGGDVSSLELARCYWRLDRRGDAAREFDEAIRRNEAPREYLELCKSAVQGDHAVPAPKVAD